MDSRPKPIDLFDDAHVKHRAAQLNGSTYHYLYAEPESGSWKATVFLVRHIDEAFQYLLSAMPRVQVASGLPTRAIE
jgi:hypothetical protein